MGLGINQFNAQENLSLCEFCINNKHHKTKLPKNPTTRALELLELVHYDICGPCTSPTHISCQYFLASLEEQSDWVSSLE